MKHLLERIDLRGESEGSIASSIAGLLPRPGGSDAEVVKAVSEIVEQVRLEGDAALRELTLRFDGTEPAALEVSSDELARARAGLPGDLRDALELAYQRITEYHRHQVPSVSEVDLGGVVVRDMVVPVERAGLYAPGGRAAYPSTVLMCAVPARVAGVGELVLCVPPGSDGHVAPVTLAAAAIAGIDEVYCVGGAQAVAAMAFGTETILPVDVIAGPGNRYVAEAKRQVAGMVGVPSAYAGPSEVVVVADGTVPAEWVAVDLLVQAEHGPDGLAWLLTWSEDVADAVDYAIATLLPTSKRREELESTLASGGYAVLVDGPSEAMAVANEVAPEHLEILTERPRELEVLVRRAGAVFLGSHSPASVGDYLAGTNHVLPTARSARFASALRVDDFCRRIHSVAVSDDALEALAGPLVALATAEGLEAHALSVTTRTNRQAT